ncbi:hypothetical protein [Micromonospora sp. NPDC023633]|uniref:hypothetical protein n=1 Tax=Micromonospora sp. NPDC023633 TaxID=3154320 RepID=UPI0033C03FED
MPALHTPALKWALGGPGWAYFTWTSGEETLRLRTSYVGDALKDLLTATLDLKLGSSATFTHFLDEPHGHRMFFSSVADNTMYVEIVRFDDLFTDNNRWAGGVPCWDGEVSVPHFIEAVQDMAMAVLKEHGEDGYHKSWIEAPFPTRELALLQQKP